MTQNSNLRLSDWLFWRPLKFSASIFILTTIATFLYTGFFVLLGTNISLIPLILIMTCIFIYCTAKLIKKLPQSDMNQTSFIAIHNAQTILYCIYLLISYTILINYIQSSINNLLFLQHAPTLFTSVLLTFFMLFFLSMLGLLISNLYAKYRRIRAIGIPTHKIILSIPFGFSALWLAGYILPEKDNKKQIKNIKTKWYQNFTSWIVSNQTNTILSFILITICSGLLFNFNKTLITLMYSLIFGIWLIQIGVKKFTKQINNAYANMAIISNILLIIILLTIKISTPTIAPDVHVNIIETTQINTGLTNE